MSLFRDSPLKKWMVESGKWEDRPYGTTLIVP
jgi:hypothetical protein